MTKLGWHPQDIIAEIRKQGWNQGQIAQKVTVSRATVGHTIVTGSSPVVRAFVARLIGVPEHELWPHRFPTSVVPSKKSPRK